MRFRIELTTKLEYEECRLRHIPEEGILHSHRRENLKSNILEYL
jgi:hypothetical protein